MPLPGLFPALKREGGLYSIAGLCGETIKAAFRNRSGGVRGLQNFGWPLGCQSSRILQSLSSQQEESLAFLRYVWARSPGPVSDAFPFAFSSIR